MCMPCKKPDQLLLLPPQHKFKHWKWKKWCCCQFKFLCSWHASYQLSSVHHRFSFHINSQTLTRRLSQMPKCITVAQQSASNNKLLRNCWLAAATPLLSGDLLVDQQQLLPADWPCLHPIWIHPKSLVNAEVVVNKFEIMLKEISEEITLKCCYIIMITKNCLHSCLQLRLVVP